jgi:hypothetical protein
MVEVYRDNVVIDGISIDQQFYRRLRGSCNEHDMSEFWLPRLDLHLRVQNTYLKRIAEALEKRQYIEPGI